MVIEPLTVGICYEDGLAVSRITAVIPGSPVIGLHRRPPPVNGPAEESVRKCSVRTLTGAVKPEQCMRASVQGTSPGGVVLQGQAGVEENPLTVPVPHVSYV